jgi:RNA polymerase sigma-70 factor (ECF subfamily)
MDQPTPPGGAAQAQGAPEVTPLSLLERLRANDDVAWKRVIQLYEPLVRFWCRRSNLRPEDMEDLTQEVFAAAAAGFARFRRDRPGDSFRGWLRGIARNQVLLHFRRCEGRPKAKGGSDTWQHLQEIPDAPPPPDDEERAVVNQVYLRALDQIRDQFEPQTWRAFLLTAVEGRAPADLVEELGMTSAAIRQAKSRVVRRLKQELGELLD